MAWIKSDQALERHPKLYDLMAYMGWNATVAVGILHRFWWWCLDYAENGDLCKHSPVRIAMSVGLDVEEAEQFIVAMTKAGLIDTAPYLRVHDWWEYVGAYLQKKYARTPERWKAIQNAYTKDCMQGDNSSTTVLQQSCNSITTVLQPSLDIDRDIDRDKIEREEREERKEGSIHRSSCPGETAGVSPEPPSSEGKSNISSCFKEPTKAANAQECREVIDDLNQVIGANYRHITPKTQQLIKARIREGFSIADFKTVHRKKFKEWGYDPKMQKFLRPETLYGTKFESYLNQREEMQLSQAGAKTLAAGMAWLEEERRKEAEHAG